MAIETVDLTIKHGDFPWFIDVLLYVYQRVSTQLSQRNASVLGATWSNLNGQNFQLDDASFFFLGLLSLWIQVPS